jgi:uncharacterized protein YecE (DUF72 family)
MIWIGTSGWIYPHWIGRFYPPGLAVRDHLTYYARYFPTVEINRSFYRLPTYEQFQGWAGQAGPHPCFCFAVKASRYITHMKKLKDVEEGINRLFRAAEALGEHLGPILYQLPPRWRANPERLEQFIARLPPDRQAAFEFRDPTWFRPENIQALRRILLPPNCTLVTSIGGPLPTPLDLPSIGHFSYLRFHNGAHGPCLADGELDFWARRLRADPGEGSDSYVYFNNDPQACAVHDALRLRELLGSLAVPPC